MTNKNMVKAIKSWKDKYGYKYHAKRGGGNNWYYGFMEDLDGSGVWLDFSTDTLKKTVDIKEITSEELPDSDPES